MTKKIKICHVASADITLKFILLDHLKFLKNNGYDVFAVSSPGKWISEIADEGISVKTIKIKRKISPLSDLVFFIRLYFYFKKEKFDIVHTHTLKPAFFGVVAAKLAKIPVIVNTVHGLDFTKETPYLIKKIIYFLAKTSSKLSDETFSVSRKIITDYVSLKICEETKIKYLGDGINFERFNPEKFSKDFILQKKKELGISTKKKVIGIIARMVYEKGYLDLFFAIKIVKNKYPNVLLLVVGQEEPEKKDAIKKDIVKNYNIEKNVLFLGERQDVEQIYPLLDIFVLPTHSEGLGLATIEASAMGIPAIVSNVGGCPETVDNNKTGFIIPIKDHIKLAEIIIYLLDNPQKAKEMGKFGRKKVLREFDERLVFDRIKFEYERLIKLKILNYKKHE